MTWAIGIDPGVKTGLAVWDGAGLAVVGTSSAIDAEDMALAYVRTATARGHAVCLVVEDARLRKWFTGGREKAQGVGSVKRDCSRWQEWAKHHDVTLYLVAPKNNTTKLDAKLFARLTGWTDRTSEHARDAAMLVYKWRR
jgi:hypothetical protein